MVTFEKSYFINRPQQEVFDFVTNPANDVQWRGSAISAEWTSPGPVGVGSTQRSVDKFLGRKIETESEVTAWDPPSQYAWKAASGPVPFEITIRFDPREGGTQVSMNGQAEMAGFFKLAEGLAGKQLEKQIDTDFNALKQLLESS